MYHPDYLGNNEFISDLNGDPYQYFWYSPFGEAIISDHSLNGTYDSPWRFNGKEFDSETGNYYYGARYYNPTTSIWLSVDPLAHEFPSWSPYHFVHGNPINLIDPTGMSAKPPVNLDNQGEFEPGDVWEDEDGTWVLNDDFEWVPQGDEVPYNEDLEEVEIDGGIMSDLARTVRNMQPAAQQTISNSPNNWKKDWASSDNWIANFTYNLSNDAFVTLQAFDFDLLAREGHVNPFTGSSFYNIDGTTNYNGTDAFVNTATTIIPYARNAKAVSSLAPRGGLYLNKLNAAQFSSSFRGTLSRLPASQRGLANRALNFGITQWNNQVTTGMMLLKF